MYAIILKCMKEKANGSTHPGYFEACFYGTMPSYFGRIYNDYENGKSEKGTEVPVDLIY